MDREITLRDYGRVLWSGRWIILAAVAVATVVGLLLTVVSTTTYTATARVYLGQPTSVSGVPISTLATNPATAPTALENDRLVASTASALGVSEDRVRAGVSISAPRAPGGAGNQPTLATISFQDGSRRVAIDGVNAYADGVLGQASQTYDGVTDIYRTRLARLRRQIEVLQGQIRGYAREIRGTGGFDTLILQSLLQNAQTQLTTAQDQATISEINLAKAQQSEAPQLVESADGATSTGSAPARLRTTVLAAIIGLIIGVIVTFIWRGSPAGRASPA